jgi:hypothetical protein
VRALRNILIIVSKELCYLSLVKAQNEHHVFFPGSVD